jgi:hypothetical protein
MKLKLITMAAIIPVLSGSSFAQPLPVAMPLGPGGSCPRDYYTSGSFCMPMQGARDAVAKPVGGTCPVGFTSSGSFCVRSGR